MTKEKDSDNKGSYHISIPSKVLHCKDIARGAKLLYIEIAMRCEKVGYCNQKNIHFSKLLDVSTVTISKWIQQLDKKFIKCKRQGQYNRIIFLSNTTEWFIKKCVNQIKKGEIITYNNYSGWIYLLKYGKFFKIGTTKYKNPTKRLNTYDKTNPFEKEIIFCEYILKCRRAEETIKTEFSHKCKKGTTEWFVFSDKDVSEIKKFVLKKSEQYLLKKEHKAELIQRHKIGLKDTQSRVNDNILLLETSALETDVSKDNNNFIDDFKIKTKKWKDEKGQTVGTDIIDYEEEN